MPQDGRHVLLATEIGPGTHLPGLIPRTLSTAQPAHLQLIFFFFKAKESRDLDDRWSVCVFLLLLWIFQSERGGLSLIFN